MRSHRIKHALVLTTAAAAALLLSGCGGSAAQPPATTSTATPSDSATSLPTASGAATVTVTSSAPSSKTAPQAGPALCESSGLTATTDATGGGAAGSVYMELILTNSGSEPCLLKGYAGVSLTAGPDGKPIGAAATRDDSTPVTDVVLAPGKAGTATLRYTQAGNYPDCARTSAAGFRVYPPNDTASLFIAQPRDACSNADIHLLTIGAFQPK